MVDVTVMQLANTLKMGSARLLEAMRQAGLPHERDDEVVSDRQKVQFLDFVQSGRRAAGAPEERRAVTIRRRDVSTHRAGGRPRGAPAVETRRKRIFVRRTAGATESPGATSVAARSEPDAGAPVGDAPPEPPSPGPEQGRRLLDGGLEILRRALERRCEACDGGDLASMLRRLITGFPQLGAPPDVLTLLHAARDARNALSHYRPERLGRGRALFYLSAIRLLLVALDMEEAAEVDRLYRQQLDAEAAEANGETEASR